MSKPNILFVMADQMTAMALPAYGSGQAITPCLDALAARGQVFEQAYCNFPLCGPSRQSMMSGRLPSRCGAFDNGTVYPPEVPSFAHYLNLAGYNTCLSGKMHFVGPDQLHGFGQRLTTDVYPADFSWTANWGDPDAKVAFQNMDNVFTAGVCARSMQLDYDEDTAYQAERWLFDQARTQAQGPWHLTVSFTHPHDPYQAPPEYWGLYDGVELDMPQPRPEVLDAHSQRMMDHYSINAASPTGDDLCQMRRGYYAAISYIDAKLARLLDVLDQTGMADNTVVVFTSDHGDMMGERGLFYKKTFFEWAARVPLIMAGAGVAPGRVARPVSLVDILPTFCELAGVAPLEACGQSLLSGVPAPVFGEYLAEGVNAPYFMIRDGDYKLLWAADDPPVLYHLPTDPDERQNVAGHAAHADALTRLVALAHDTWDSDAIRAAVIDNQNRRRLVGQAGPAQWDHAPDLSMQNFGARLGHIQFHPIV